MSENEKDQRGDQVPMYIYLPGALHRGARVLAFNNEFSIAEVVRRALRAYLDKEMPGWEDSSGVTATLTQVKKKKK